MVTIENLDVKTLGKAFRRLKKDTRHFERLLVRDPTDFVDFQVQLKQELEALTSDLISGRYVAQKPVLHPFPKSKGINRPTVVFDVRDALVYRFCVEQVEDEIVAATRRNPNIRGGVKISPNADPSDNGYYEKFFKDWMEHNEAIRAGLEKRPVAASTDIASYFEGIDVPLLIDLVRSTVSGKAGVVNLLGVFLRSTKVEYEYGVSMSTGLPQEDIDCSRTLAYFYLHSHDDRMVRFALENDAELFRFADDITILVGSMAEGRKALKTVTESLRDLGLVASIEKTDIVSSTDVAEQLMYEENVQLDVLDSAITGAAKIGCVPIELSDQLEALYGEWKLGPQSKKKNWRKVLKRFYTLATLSRAGFLAPEFNEHVVEYPTEVQDKITKYMVRIQGRVEAGQLVEDMLSYLDADENLYPSLESTLLEAFLYLDPAKLSIELQAQIAALGRRLVFDDAPPLSDYARALGALLCFRFDPKSVNDIAAHYLRNPPVTGILRKYLVFVALTSSDSQRRAKVLAKARSEQDASLNRLTALIDNLPTSGRSSAVKAYLKRKNLYFLGFEILEAYRPVRQEVLTEIIRRHAPG